MKKLTIEDFIQKANEVHNHQYDYSATNYEHDRIPVAIICPSHGIFNMTPNTHKNGGKCPGCIIEQKKNEFIKKAQALYGNLYDYSHVVYVTNKTKVKIICTKHGEFLQTPNNHLNNHGCPHCGNEIKGSTVKLSQEQFLEKAKKVHGNKYNYYKSVYMGNDKKVIIICKKHGEFEQTANAHLAGHGCPKCKAEKSRRNPASAKDVFIEKASKIHNNKYIYDRTIYVNDRTKIIITCPKHGHFLQQPRYHLNNKQGCPQCGNERVSEFRTSNTEEFIKKAKQKHGDKFDYTKTKYVSARDGVEIICPEHGPFIQIATVHLRCKDGGCPKCKINKFSHENTDHVGNKFSSIVEKCKYWNINTTAYRTRIKCGWSEEEALICPPKMSLGEFRIKQVIEKNGITFLHNTSIQRPIRDNTIYMENKQHCFDTIHMIADKYNISAKSLAYLKYDFILLNKNKILCIIEFDGEQHFKYNAAFFKTKKDFCYRILLDNVKTDIANALKIPLIRIRYDQQNQIDSILESVLNNPSNFKDKINPLLSNNEYWSILKEYDPNYKPKCKNKHVVCIETGKMYEGTKFAQNDTGADRHCILKCIREERKTAGGYHWRYATPEEIKAQQPLNT